MKAVIAYALVVVGLTQLVGMLVGSVISLPIAMLLPHGPVKMRVVPLLEFFHGAAALAAALTLFWLLGVSISITLPLIIGAWLTFYFFSYGQQKSAWVATIVGVIASWTVYRIAFVA